MLSITTDHGAVHDVPVFDAWGRDERWQLTLSSREVAEVSLRDRPQVFLDREIDLVDASGRPVLSGYEAGPINRKLRKRALMATAGWGVVRLIDHPVGTDRHHDCCRPRLVRGDPTPAGMRSEAWMAHEWQADGPDGWHLRVYDAGGRVALERTRESLDYHRMRRYFDPLRTYPV